MVSKTWVVFCFVVTLASCEVEERKGFGRKPKLLSFNTVDGDITVNLEFSIPFLTIPTKKVGDSAMGFFSSGLPSVNLNPTALALGGAVVLATTVLVPLFVKKFAYQFEDHRFSRILDDTEFGSDAVLEFARQMLSDDRAVRGCTLRIACWAAQKSSAQPDAAGGWSKVLNNSIVSSVINSTAVEDAMYSGRNGRSCMSYAPCPLREEHMPFLLNHLATFAGSIG